MAECCGLCSKPLYTIDKLLQCYSSEVRVGDSIIPSSEPVEPTTILAENSEKCEKLLLHWARFLRRNRIYQIKHTDSSNCGETYYSYYCHQCGPRFKDATPYYGSSWIKHQPGEFSLDVKRRDLKGGACSSPVSFEESPGKGLYRVTSPPAAAQAHERTPLMVGAAAGEEKKQLYDFQFSSPAAIYGQLSCGAPAYDRNISHALYPPLFVALYILSESFRRFVDEARAKEMLFTRELYRQTKGLWNTQKIIEHWLSEAQTTLEAVNKLYTARGINPQIQNSLILQRAAKLTVIAVEGLLVQADGTMLPRPTYSRWFIFCITLMAFLTYMIFYFTSRHPHQILPTPQPRPTFPHSTTTTTTTVTTTHFSPCSFQHECSKVIYQQILSKLHWFLTQGYVTVGDVFAHCSDYAIFNFFRQVCFATNPDFAERIQADDSIQGLIDFFEAIIAS